MIRIQRKGKSVKAIVPLTPSKSITNRVLIIRSLCDEIFEIENMADAGDSKILKLILEKLPETIDAKDAGTVFRFLTAFLSITEGSFILTGSERMLQRPVGKLVQALRSIGAEIEFRGVENFPPLKITGKKLLGGKVEIDGSESSQFISALMLIAPKLKNGLTIELSGRVYSKSYIDLTESIMKKFGINIQTKNNKIEIIPGEYKSKSFAIENDWSSASFWYEIAALSDHSEILIRNLNLDSMQGDVVIDQLMKSFGVFSEKKGDDLMLKKESRIKLPDLFEYDFSSCPDIVIPVAVVCATLKVKSVFRGVKNLRIKESDRLQSLKYELEKIGAEIILEENTLTILPSEVKSKTQTFHSYNDHRMVMAFAPLALVLDAVRIDDHLPVKKSYPGFWEQFSSAGFDCTIT